MLGVALVCMLANASVAAWELGSGHLATGAAFAMVGLGWGVLGLTASS